MPPQVGGKSEKDIFLNTPLEIICSIHHLRTSKASYLNFQKINERHNYSTRVEIQSQENKLNSCKSGNVIVSSQLVALN